MNFSRKMKTYHLSHFCCGTILLLLCVVAIPSNLYAQTEKPVYRYYYSEQERQANAADKKYKLLPPSVFLTFNAGIYGNYNSKNFFAYRNPSFGFKVGTMKNTGWFLDIMSNFNFKGAFNKFTQPESIQKKSNFHFDATIGITGRYFKPVTFLFGVGGFYHSLNSKNASEVWGHFAQDIEYGPMLSTGFMFHIYKVAFSVEVSCNYNLANRDTQTRFTSERIGFGAKLGIGFCMPRNSKKTYGLTSTHRNDLDGYGKVLRTQTPISFTPSSHYNTPDTDSQPSDTP